MDRKKLLFAGAAGLLTCSVVVCLFQLPMEKIAKASASSPLVVPVRKSVVEPPALTFPSDLYLESTRLAVKPVLQLPELPNGCEITSLTTVLNYYGFDVDKEEMAVRYLPYEEFTFDGNIAIAPDPEDAYAGDPFSEHYAFYCFTGPIVDAANAYLKTMESDYTAVDATGSSLTDLVNFVQNGQPVIVWATIHFAEPEFTEFWWMTPEGEEIHPYSNLHCLVLTGFDGISAYLCDPLVGRIVVRASVFAQRYQEMGERAVVLDRAPDNVSDTE